MSTPPIDKAQAVHSNSAHFLAVGGGNLPRDYRLERTREAAFGGFDQAELVAIHEIARRQKRRQGGGEYDDCQRMTQLKQQLPEEVAAGPECAGPQDGT